MSVDLIRYDLLVQDALRGVVRRVLGDVARDGLPGEHHLYISFDTRAAGVRISSRLKEKYPEEMTIILQHQFWDLIVTEQYFEVGLSFNRVPERLHVPFAALKGFFDPSVKFGLQFEPSAAEEEPEEPAPAPVQLKSVPTSPAPAAAAPVAAAPATPLPARAEPRPVPAKPEPAKVEAARAETAKADSAKTEAGGSSATAKTDGPAAAPARKDRSTEAKPADAAAAKPSAEPASPEPETGGAQVVRLDAFRKK
ncbi:SspB family protein [Ancylobacter lacus]|uniref:SspB family protein n=1 Tax=Ancylobacter lacus TaxID=2579970 RepID=UPI001BCBEFC7|nr:ClpXP protease specificity-enhancing factor SspB [Ancylobacter lacus]MBS7541467.1 hypothetical protein [Ancylobacter lacus]